MRMHLCIHVYVCMYVCMYACMYLCTSTRSALKSWVCGNYLVFGTGAGAGREGAGAKEI